MFELYVCIGSWRVVMVREFEAPWTSKRERQIHKKTMESEYTTICKDLNPEQRIKLRRDANKTKPAPDLRRNRERKPHHRLHRSFELKEQASEKKMFTRPCAPPRNEKI